jgi:hypothetical protein
MYTRSLQNVQLLVWLMQADIYKHDFALLVFFAHPINNIKLLLEKERSDII